jgi:phosphatidylserine/phosphatidylglycerophosphate/cardiolipin synthase-like enzyme/uncharacterized membrane protein YdjX (TVP38/TMEM64 family)
VSNPEFNAPSASLLRPGHNCCAVARAERVALLVDTEAYFKAFYQAALRARRSITILAWDFNSQTKLHFDPVAEGAPPALLGEFLNYLVRRRRVRVNVLDWDYPLVYGTDRELRPVYGFGWKPSRRVHLRYDDTHPFAGSQHQKIVIIDDAVAFVGGIDLTVRRWDTPEHRPDDPRRTAYGKPYPPVHDLMVALDGDAARALSAITRERWQRATGKKLKPVSAGHDPWPSALQPDLCGVEVGIARTMPPRGEVPAVREVERLYLDMIAAGRKYIYIESQYFTAPRLAAALEQRLAEPGGPEVVLVLRLLSHGWLEEHTMHVLRTRLIRRLKEADRYARFHVYYPHMPGVPEGWCLDVHSKTMVVDDRCLRIGSANLCSRSMGVDTECDVLIESLGDARVAAAISGFRDRLLAEHLGVTQEEFSRELQHRGSMHGAVEALRGPDADLRTLHDLDEPREWPEAILNIAGVADPDEPIAFDMLRTQLAYDDPPSAMLAERPAWGRLALIALGFALLAAAWRFTPLADVVTAEKVIAWAHAFGSQWWAPLVVMLAYTPACFVMFPRPLITLASVIAFKPWLGFVYALAGILFSAVVTYYVGKRMRRDTVRRLAGPHLDKMVEVLKKHGLLALTLLRLVPMAPFAVEGIVAGAVRLKLWHLVLGTAIGMLPGTLATTVLGGQIESALSGGRFNWWIVSGVALVLVAGVWYVKRWFGRMASREASGQPR